MNNSNNICPSIKDNSVAAAGLGWVGARYPNFER